MLDYKKIQRDIVKWVYDGRVKLGRYQEDFAVIVDGNYLFLIPEKEFMFDAGKLSGRCRQEKLIDCTKFFDHLDDAKTILPTGFNCIKEKKEYAYYKEETGADVKILKEPLKYLDRYSDPLLVKAPGRAMLVYLYAAGNITILSGLIMPAYFEVNE